jgi:hypothetical protein
MKKLAILSILFFVALGVFAQAPNYFNYQAVARNTSGALLSQQNVSFRISILQSSAAGTAVYVETHNTTTNDYGLANLKIGLGTVVSGSISAITWESNNYFLKVEMDPAGGSAFQLMGTTQLISVPYAMYANKAGAVASTGQSVYQALGTGQLSVTSAITSFTLVPGLSLNVNVPSGCKVLIHTDGGLQCSATGNAYSVVDMSIHVDNVSQAQRRIVAANTTGLAQVITNWSMDRMMTLAAGNHTFEVRAMYATGSGASTANVSSGSAPQLQGVLTVTIIKE